MSRIELDPETLRAALAITLPASTTLLLPLGDEGVDWLWIQGRQDRLHRILLDPSRADEDVRVNWRWIVTRESNVDPPAGHGRLLWTPPDALRIDLRAPPAPGIFLRDLPEPFRAWRALSTF